MPLQLVLLTEKGEEVARVATSWPSRHNLVKSAAELAAQPDVLEFLETLK